jgi:hypothetical protein
VGILALRFVAGWCIRLIDKYPILEQTAFLLIGYVGFILIFELLSNPKSGLQVFPGPVHVSSLQKFLGIIIILGLSLFYAKSEILQASLKPVFIILVWPMRMVAMLVGNVIKLMILPFKLIIGIFRKEKTEQKA